MADATRRSKRELTWKPTALAGLRSLVRFHLQRASSDRGLLSRWPQANRTSQHCTSPDCVHFGHSQRAAERNARQFVPAPAKRASSAGRTSKEASPESQKQANPNWLTVDLKFMIVRLLTNAQSYISGRYVTPRSATKPAHL